MLECTNHTTVVVSACFSFIDFPLLLQPTAEGLWRSLYSVWGTLFFLTLCAVELRGTDAQWEFNFRIFCVTTCLKSGGYGTLFIRKTNTKNFVGILQPLAKTPTCIILAKLGGVSKRRHRRKDSSHGHEPACERCAQIQVTVSLDVALLNRTHVVPIFVTFLHYPSTSRSRTVLHTIRST